jgi:signal transduction histidine kinase
MAKTSIRALLVEDDSCHAKIVERVLADAELAAFTLKCVESLEAARDSMAGNEFDVVLLDLGLSDARGMEALHGVRKQSPDVPVVVLTANSDPHIGIQAVAQGAQDFLYKGDLFSRALERVLLHAVRRQEMLGIIQAANSLLDRKNDELKTANQLLDQKNKQLARLYDTAHQFVDNVSHEFRTPLAVIKEFVTLVREGSAGEINLRQSEFLEIVNDRVDDMAIMVEDMLDVSCLEVGLLSVWRQNSAISQIIDHVRPTLQRKAAARNISFEVSLDPDLPPVYCDRDKIGRVIVTLATNAIKFCSQGGSVKLWAKTGSDGSDVVVGITDDGPGVAPENLKRIIDLFKQVGTAAPGATHGFGLGLAIVKELVALNLGEIDVHSEVGAGSTFAFSVPVNDAPELAARYARHASRLRGKPQISIVTAETSLPITSKNSDLADEFLHYVLRASDLVIRTLPNKWLIMAQAQGREVDAMLARVTDAWAQANGGRCGEKLPEIRFLFAGTWQLPAGEDDLLRCCRSELAAMRPMPVGRRVLVVDDDRELVRGLSLRLHAAGYDVFTAKDGNAAINAAIEHHPHAILMDNYMSGMDGILAMDRLSEHPDTKDIPIIMLSASIRDQQKALRQGAKFFFEKPCNHNTIVAALGNVINQEAEAPSG